MLNILLIIPRQPPTRIQLHHLVSRHFPPIADRCHWAYSKKWAHPHESLDDEGMTAYTGQYSRSKLPPTMRLEVESTLSITIGSSMILTCPAQCSQVNISALNTLLSRCIQVIDAWRSAGVLSGQLSPVG